MTSSDRKPSKTSTVSSSSVAGHMAVLILMLAFLLLPAFVHVSGPPYESMSVFGLKTPSMCFTKTWFDFDCVTCGLSRSYSLVTHGRFAEAFQVHSLGPVLYACMLAEAIFRIVVIRKGTDWVKHPIPRCHMLIWVVMVAAMIFTWLYQVFVG